MTSFEAQCPPPHVATPLSLVYAVLLQQFATMNNTIVSPYIQPTLASTCEFKKKESTAHSSFKFIINLPTRKKHRREAVKDHKVTQV